MIHIRRMEAGDAAGMHEVHTAAVRQVCAVTVAPVIVDAWLHDRTPEGYTRAAKKGGETFWVAIEEPDRVVGFGSWRQNELVSLFVDPPFQGHGIGRKLFASCEVDAASNGHSITHLNSTLNAQSFYETLGFHRIRDGFRKMHGQRVPHIEMVRDG